LILTFLGNMIALCRTHILFLKDKNQSYFDLDYLIKIASFGK
jgi:hypothetical protein